MIDIEAIKHIIGSNNVRQDEDMSKHTTFRTGGKAALFLTPDMNNISELISYLSDNKVDYYIAGNGSNLLVKDTGYDGAVINIGNAFSEVSINGNEILAGAGVMLSKLSAIACTNSLTGMEFASGIPGTLGGAVTMNAGAYGGEMSQVLKTVSVIDENGKFIILNIDELNLSYRHSIVMEKNYIVLSALIKLEVGNAENIKAKMDELSTKRKEKQPLEYPSAGSTFKRPDGYFAGKLIMDSGLKGYMHGGAQVSEKHCGFVINRNNATATDIIELMDEVSNTVFEKYGVRLEPEVKILG